MNHLDATRKIRKTWLENRAEEIEFWTLILSGRYPVSGWCEDARKRLLEPRHLIEPLAGFASEVDGRLVEIIDVGSGPAPYLGLLHPSKVVRVLQADPLADEYNRILRDHNYGHHANIVRIDGERLSSELPHEHFDIAYSRNALDHSWDPLRCIDGMLQITRVGGHVFFEGHTDEGVRQNYHGLHQWNFRSLPDGDCLLWRPGTEVRLRERMGDAVDFISRGNDHWFSVSITKRGH